MLNKKEFILLKMIFDPVLYESVQAQDLKRVLERLESHYEYELENGFVSEETIDEEDLVEIKSINEEELKHDDLSWAL